LERWKVNLYTVWFTQIIMITSFSFGMPFFPFYIRELGITDPESVKIYTSILWIVPGVSMAVMSPIWGIAADKWGKKLMLLRAMLFAVFIFGGMGFAVNISQLIALRFLQGVFTGTVTASAALVASGTPSERLSYAVGFLSSSTFIGSSAGPVIGGLIADYYGYRVSFIMGGLLMFVDFMLVLFLVKEEKNIPAADIEEASEKKEENKGKPSIIGFFTGLIVTMLFTAFILRFARAVFLPYTPLFIEENLKSGGIISPTKATGIINGVTGAMTAVAGITLSRMGDKYNRFKIIRVLFVLAVLVSIPLAVNKNIFLFTLLYGSLFFLLGGIEPVVTSIATQATPVERRGFLFGILGLVGNVANALSPVLGGFISVNASTHAVLYSIPVLLIFGFAAILYYGLVQRRKNAAQTKTSG
jgi:DHA1 family multidrug resistance protein-like MFS transporter